ncbi:TonB-dependent receptor [Porticoccaceae bacterium LTM1]|nr:TonB-dependent receptor [Porticoccaceae bacterium LTM1]
MKSQRRGFKKNRLMIGIASAIALTLSADLLAEPEKIMLDLKGQNAGKAILDLAAQTHTHIVLPDGVGVDLELPALKGEFTLASALDALLAGSGLVYEFLSSDSVIIKEDEVDNKKSDKQSQEVEEIVVTGSRIAQASSQLASNLITLDIDELRATGEVTLERALRQLPQNMFGASEVGGAVRGSFNSAQNLTGGSSINLRGLGSESTLVLIDGRRIGKSGIFGGISDISGIPLSSVDRVEIMLDGASSVYGSDAVGGVVNIILKKDYEGLELGYDFGKPQDGGFEEHILTLSGGFSWDSGRARVNFEHFSSSNLDFAERPERVAWSQFLAPAKIARSLGTFNSQPLFYQYSGQNYLPSELAALGLTPTSQGVVAVTQTVLPIGQDGSNLTAADFTALDAPINYNADSGNSLLPAKDRNTLRLGFDQELSLWNSDITLTGDIYYSAQDTYAATGGFELPMSLLASHPVNPFETDIGIYWSIPSLPDRHYQTESRVFRWNLGLDGSFADDWNWNLSIGQSRDKIDSLYFNEPIQLFDYFGTGAANVLSLIEEGELNLLGGDIDAVNTPEQLAALVGPPRPVQSTNKESTAEVSLNGPLFRLPGGDVHLAVGAQWREETLISAADVIVSQTGLGQGSSSLPQWAYTATEVSRSQHSAFAEILVPIVGENNAVPMIEKLTVTGSGRYDSYDQYGSDSTWSLGMIWSPDSQIRFKVNHATSYVVPTPKEALIPPNVFSSLPLFTFTIPVVDVNGFPTGQFEAASTLISGGNPDLRPETASSLSAGIEIEPDFIPGLSLSAIWHQTEYENRISGFDGRIGVLGPNYEERYPDNISRDEFGYLVLDYRAVNLASLDVSGIDYKLRYKFDTSIGEFLLNANVAYTDKWDKVSSPGAEVESVVKDAGFGTLYVIPELRYSANLGWYNRGLSINIDASKASDTTSRNPSVFLTQTEIRTSKTPLNLDLVASYNMEEGDLFQVADWLKDSTVSFRVLNLLDDHPEHKVTILETGEPDLIPEFNANLADPRGRMFYVSFTKRF